MKILIKYKITILTAITVTLLTLINSSNLPKNSAFIIPHFDKFVHFSMYCAVTFFFFAERYNWNKSTYQHLLNRPNGIPILLFIISGGVLEILQPLVSNRHCDFYDFIANSAGALSGFYFYSFFILIKNRLKMN